MKKIILASASPRRHELLDLLGIEHEVIPCKEDEKQIRVVDKSKLEVIKEIIQKRQGEYLQEDESFRIDLKRRNNEVIDRTQLIKVVAEIFNNKVDLDNPDKIIRIEILGNFCGISFLQLNDIIKASNENNEI